MRKSNDDFDWLGEFRQQVLDGNIVVKPDLEGATKRIAIGALTDFKDRGTRNNLLQWRPGPLPPVNTLPGTARLLVAHKGGFAVLVPPPNGSTTRAAGLWDGGLAAQDISKWIRLV